MFRSKLILVSLLVLTMSGAAHADTRDVVHDEASGTIARSSSGACIRTQWSNSSDVCATEVAAPAQQQVRTEVHQAAALSREERTIYFGFNQASLSPEMKQRLETLSATLRSDSQVKGARIVGYADRIGNAGYNEKLSKKRAENTRQYLVSHGMINTNVADTRWFGATTPATDCSGKLKRPELIACLQPDRRVEVEIDFTPDVRAER